MGALSPSLALAAVAGIGLAVGQSASAPTLTYAFSARVEVTAPVEQG
ncbi:hypothetical protein [Sphingomonas sp. J315]|nr:hypothetical protein [Sphingomonas sp. J315]UUX99222.1 hypothetical protein LRS08_17375 [Sphingomonas sp. J315]